MFKFKLQTVLDVRKTLEDKAIGELSTQQKTLHDEEEALVAIRNQLTSLVDALRAIKGKPVSAFEITMGVNEIKECIKKEEAQGIRVKEAEKRLVAKRLALLEAVRKRKALEILRGKDQTKFLSSMNQLEQIAHDEMSLVRHQRRDEG